MSIRDDLHAVVGRLPINETAIHAEIDRISDDVEAFVRYVETHTPAEDGEVQNVVADAKAKLVEPSNPAGGGAPAPVTGTAEGTNLATPDLTEGVHSPTSTSEEASTATPTDRPNMPEPRTTGDTTPLTPLDSTQGVVEAQTPQPLAPNAGAEDAPDWAVESETPTE